MSDTKKILITGAEAGGIPGATLQSLNENQCSVYALVDREKINKFTDDQRSLVKAYCEVDFTSSESIADAITQFKDIRFNGISLNHMMFHMEVDSSFDHTKFLDGLKYNLYSYNHIVRALESQLLDGASIVCLSTTEAFAGSFGATNYAATKAALHNLTQSWANLFGPRQIRSNIIAAGWIGGVMDTDEVFKKSTEITPLGRLGAPEEVANVILFLLSDRSTFISGATIIVDGGYRSVDVISKFEYKDAME